MIKVLLFDIDDTLVDFKTHPIPISTTEALEAAKAKGIRIFIATDRPHVIINNLASLQNRKLIDGYITMNSAYYFISNTVIYENSILTTEVGILAKFCYERNIPCVLAGEHNVYANQPSKIVAEIFNN